jgi:Ca2+-binding EF-hand superfamily protein
VYDQNNNGTLELTEVTQMINTSLRHNNVMKKFSMSDAKEFINIADKNNDNRISK